MRPRSPSYRRRAQWAAVAAIAFGTTLSLLGTFTLALLLGGFAIGVGVSVLILS